MTPIKVMVSGAAGQIAYSLLPLSKSNHLKNISLTQLLFELVCNGLVFGPERHLDLRLLDIERAQEPMEGVKMELQDCSFHLVDVITPTSDVEVAFRDVDVAILLGGFPRLAGMERYYTFCISTLVYLNTDHFYFS